MFTYVREPNQNFPSIITIIKNLIPPSNILLISSYKGSTLSIDRECIVGY